VSVAFLVGDDGFALPLAAEFIENPDSFSEPLGAWHFRRCPKEIFDRI
jgi:hypothetical protein